MPKGWLTCFAVARPTRRWRTVEAKGGKVTMPPMDTPFGRFAIVEDPWGAPFEVMRTAAAEPEPGVSRSAELAVGVLGPEPDDEPAVGDHGGAVLVPVRRARR